MSSNWDDEAVLLLIQHFRENDILWNPRNTNYKNRNKRMDALNTIASLFGIDKSEIERKLKNLTSHYFREKKKVQESRKPGTGADVVHEPKWFAYKALGFLRDKNKPQTQKIATHKTDSEFCSLQTVNSENTSLAESQQDVMPSSSKKRYNTDGDSDIYEALKVLKDISASKPVRDDASLFGDYIASKIRKMDRITSATVQHHIQNIIYQAEIGNYSRRHSPTTNSPEYFTVSTFDDNTRPSTSQSCYTSNSDTQDRKTPPPEILP